MTGGDRFAFLEFNGKKPPAGWKPEDELPVKDADHYLQEADTRYHQGRFEEALRYYSKVLQHDTRVSRAWVGQVRMLIELEEYREAQVWAVRAAEELKDEQDLIAAQAVVCARTGKLADALAFSDGALAGAGATPYRWQARGEVLLARGDRFENECFKKALLARPRDWTVLMEIGRIYLHYGKPVLAMQHLQQALELHTDAALVWSTLGEAQAALGLDTRARQSFSRALELDRDCQAAKEALLRMDREGPLAGIIRRVAGWFRSAKK